MGQSNDPQELRADYLAYSTTRPALEGRGPRGQQGDDLGCSLGPRFSRTACL